MGEGEGGGRMAEEKEFQAYAHHAIPRSGGTLGWGGMGVGERGRKAHMRMHLLAHREPLAPTCRPPTRHLPPSHVTP